MRVRHNEGLDARSLDVADIGCGAGTQALLWAVGGHRVCGLDISEQLVELARKRASESVLAADFRLGSALRLPWPDESMDICLVIELLEHVSQWQVCLRECARVLRPMGILFLTTTNALCPFQEEFNLPLYGWYPRSVKRYFERLAKTKRPDLANYATYPAINWLNFYSIRSFLQPVGLHCLDRFDLIDAENKTRVARFVISCIRSIPPLRFMAHLTSHSTTLLAIKSKEPGSYGTSGISLFRNRILG
jgi:2-polyprenyl-6-hydroxyphenyl methylase/3-demethylubiquinone-9 3-methyltransferase